MNRKAQRQLILIMDILAIKTMRFIMISRMSIANKTA
jgi:hypothetical protein